MLIVAGIVLAVCLAGLAVGGVTMFNAVRNATAPARDAADAFVRDLEAGNAAGAHARLCRDTRERFSLDAFAGGVHSQARITGHRILGVNVSTVNGQSTAQVTMDLTYASGFTDRHSFLLVVEDDQWRVCGNPY
jgi:hypothetical protein